jgi:esterase
MEHVPTLTARERGPVALTSGPRTFPSFAAMLDAVAAASGRAPEDVWRGARLNSRPLEGGGWGWRYDQLAPADGRRPDFRPLWEDLSSSRAPLMVVRSGRGSHVPDGDLAEYRRRRPDVRIEVVAGAGHSVQSDRPRELARLVEDFAFASGGREDHPR